MRAGFDRVVVVLDIFGNLWNEHLKGGISGIAKAFCLLERCRSRVIALFLLLFRAF